MAFASSQVGAQVRLGDADCPTDTGGKQLAGLDQSADGFGADAEVPAHIQAGSFNQAPTLPPLLPTKLFPANCTIESLALPQTANSRMAAITRSGLPVCSASMSR